jgi:hypothetical protein
MLSIGGAQWAGKTSIARLLAARHGLQHYDYDFHDARSHAGRARADPERYSYFHRGLARTADQSWVLRSPQEMAASTLRVFEERFRMVLEDLEKLPVEPPVLVEGWGIRPDLVAPLLKSRRQAIWLVPTEGFRRHQLEVLPRAQRVSVETSDPERAQRNRLKRDQLLARDVVESARQLGLRVVRVDGRKGLAEVAALVEAHFRPFLPLRVP